jgi:hypothetical protein
MGKEKVYIGGTKSPDVDWILAEGVADQKSRNACVTLQGLVTQTACASLMLNERFYQVVESR